MEYLYMSQEGFDALKKELDLYKKVKRKEISKAIGTAREKGDLSENAEYHAAKEEQALIEKKIVELENSFALARVMDTTKLDTSKAMLLSKVKIKNLKNSMQLEYQLVSHAEADIKLKKISIDSPIGKGLLGSIVGDVVEITIPNGKIEFEILDINVG